MKSSAGFKRPTIKATSRAYVRLFECFRTPEEWLSFLSRFRVEHPASGMQRNGDCAVRVIDPSTGEVATLGLEIPNEIKYHTYIATARSFWTESFTSATQRRRRVWEIGYSQPSTDEVLIDRSEKESRSAIHPTLGSLQSESPRESRRLFCLSVLSKPISRMKVRCQSHEERAGIADEVHHRTERRGETNLGRACAAASV